MTVALCSQQLTTPTVVLYWQQLCSDTEVAQEAVLIVERIFVIWKQNISQWSSCGNKISHANFCILLAVHPSSGRSEDGRLNNCALCPLRLHGLFLSRYSTGRPKLKYPRGKFAISWQSFGILLWNLQSRNWEVNNRDTHH